MSSRSRAGGLPSGPGPRARSVTRTRDADRGRYDNESDGGASSRSSARQIRPQKSLTSMNQSRSTSQAPPLPSSRSRRDPNPSYDSRVETATNRSSDSTTSSGSSFFDRMKQSAGYASSRTSLEDDEPEKRPARSMRNNNRSGRGDSPPPETDTPGDGYTLWSKFASTASSLTVNVGKAWATNITTFAGEETPVGQESRLTRAMKAYHLEKARDPSDLPAWLFDEKERRRPAPAAEPVSRSRRRNDEYADDDYEVVEKRRAEPPASRGLRDIYEAAAASSASSTPSARSPRGGRSYADDSAQPSRATDRLKALRDAKRGALNGSVREERAEAEETAPRRRVGLPSGPVRRF
ncbi:hypothetical protein C8R47DRAFT_1184559 [Mycena vitilis]|nr:hypothetical protein C8R47DRAFT_1184559 [Mycena vitilis]